MTEKKNKDKVAPKCPTCGGEAWDHGSGAYTCKICEYEFCAATKE